jgi:hypothetical protein
MAGSRPYNKTIFTVVEKSLVEEAIEGIKRICRECDGPGTGLLVALPVEEVARLGDQR